MLCPLHPTNTTCADGEESPSSPSSAAATTTRSSSSGSRGFWKTARERNRLQARFIIRERVNGHHRLKTNEHEVDDACAAVPEQDEDYDDDDDDDDDAIQNHAPALHESSSIRGDDEIDFTKTGTIDDDTQRLISTAEAAVPAPPHTSSMDDALTIRPLLQRIIDNDRSFFSVTYLAEHETLLSSVFSTFLLWAKNDNEKDKNDHISNDDNDDDEKRREQQQQQCCLLGEEKLVSWYGPDSVRKELYAHVKDLDSFTFMEYALLFQRYYIVAAFINGGINPCHRGGIDTHLIVENCGTNAKRLHRMGEQVLRRFLMDPVPLPLSSYMVKRVFDLRRAYWKRRRTIIQQQQQQHDATANDEGTKMLTASSFCPVCQCTLLPNLLVCFPSCQHVVCEACFWKDSLERLNDRNDNEDVVQCQVCKSQATIELSGFTVEHNNTNATVSSSSSLLSPKDRFEQSRQRYLSLPVNARELKSLKDKKKCKPNGRFILAATWSDAIRPSLGLTQNVRRDKFFLFVERGAFHHVRCCLEAGIDLSLQNEYGQTALYICAWRGSEVLVDLLLQYGADPWISANGSGRGRAVGTMTPLRVAAYSGNKECYNLIRQFMSAAAASSLDDRNGSEDNIIPNGESSSCCPLSILPGQLETLIPETASHPGAGSYLLHDILSDQEIEELVELWKSLPIAPPDVVKKKKKSVPCSIRSYFCDTEQRISRLILRALGSFQPEKPAWCKCDNINDKKDTLAPLPVVFPHMRFLCYEQAGAELAPHIDLPRVGFVTPGNTPSCNEQQPRRSTHSFLLYLTHCQEGGETRLLGSLSGKGRENVLARVKPRRGHLLLFPHNCPHQGEEVVDVPKLLIRGEVILPPRSLT